MNIVLMDTKHHKTIMLEAWVSNRIIVPVWLPTPVLVHALDDQLPITQLLFRGLLSAQVAHECVFTHHQGDELRGDLIFLQTSGIAIPAEWWGCDDSRGL